MGISRTCLYKKMKLPIEINKLCCYNVNCIIVSSFRGLYYGLEGKRRPTVYFY